MDVVDIETLRRVLRDYCLRNSHGFVSRIVKHLNLELLAWIVERSHDFQQTIDDVQLVEEWKLDRDHRQLCFLVFAAGFRQEFTITPEVDHLLDAIRAVHGERAENGEVNDQNDPIERVELVQRADISPRFVNEIVEVSLKKDLW